MLCISCQNEVPSKFAYAIKSNVCPFCGKGIMTTELQEILSGLQEVMSAAVEQSYEAETLNWLGSNFNMVNRDSEEFTSLQKEVGKLNAELISVKDKFVKPVPKSGKLAQQAVAELQMGIDEEGHQVQLGGHTIQDPEVTQNFMERASAGKMADRNDHFRQMVSQIKKSGTGGTTDGGSMVISPAMLAAADPAEIEEMEQMLSGGAPIVSSAIDSDYDDDDALPPIAEAFIAGGAGKQVQGYNPRDVAKLQQLQQKSAKASRALDSGGNIGLIRR